MLNLTLLVFIIILIIYIIIYYDNINNKSIEGFEEENNEGLNKCDGIVYINLENREDRKKLFLEEVKKININENKLHKVSGIYIPKNGHKGNVQSFILGLTLAKINNWNMVAIFEDDMEIIKDVNFNEECDYIINKLNNNVPDWDVIMLGTANSKKENVDFDNKICKINIATTKTGIIVQKHYYDKLINNFNSSNDLMLVNRKSNEKYEKYASDQRMGVLQETGKWFGFHNDIIKQRNIWSSTMKNSY
jgi:glycosyl transferase family 25